MKRSKFTDSQIMDTLKRAEAGLAVPDLCRELGISSATFYKWRAKFGGMDTSMISRMKELEDENRFCRINCERTRFCRWTLHHPYAGRICPASA
jgi:putative transposase